MISRRDLMTSAALASAAALAPFGRAAKAAPAQILRIGMTTSDLPTVTGLPNNGGEGYRFLGYPPYDGLTNWDFTHPDRIAVESPGLCTAWKVDEADPNRWLFTVRAGVKFHDGTDFDADAVTWNLARIYDSKAPQFDAQAAPIVSSEIPMLDSWKKIDEATVEITTKYPFSFLPAMLTKVLIVSPTQWEKVGRSWVEFAKNPIGTGPFKITRVAPGQYCEMTRNSDYWDKTRVPKLEKLVVYPMPETTTRLAALRSGQVDWIEVPPPDAIPSLKAAGFDISLWSYPHTWPYLLNCTASSPFHDVRVRQAANYAIDREGICALLNGTAKPAGGVYDEDHPAFGAPKNAYKLDPDKARALLAEAGYGPDKRVKAKIMISTSGSGQMVPIPMNEFLQQNLRAVGIDVDFDVMEWGALLVAFRHAPEATESHGADGANVSLSYMEGSSMFRYLSTKSWTPTAANWGHWSNPEADKLFDQAQAAFDLAEQTKLLAQAHAIVVDEAPWLFVVHDLNPRAMNKKVQDFKPAQSWYQDFTQVHIV
jgi:peptide/nickel transport system substrate-binding protein